MDTLPQELVNRIAGFVEEVSHYWRLAPMATISHAWQEAIESITFRKLIIKSDELYTFRLLLTGRRSHHLANLEFEVVLPTYTKRQYRKTETHIDKLANDACFTQAVRELFAILKTWENKMALRPMCLELGTVFSALDRREGIPTSTISRSGGVSYIGLNDPESLPTLSRVRELIVQHPIDRSRWILPQVAPWLSKSLPNLKDTFWYFHEFSGEEERDAFAEAVQGTRLLPRSKLAIEIDSLRLLNDDSTVESIISPYDLLSAAIRTMSYNVTIMTLKLDFDETLLWPSSDEAAGTPYWPHLKELEVRFNMYTPDTDMAHVLLEPPASANDRTIRGAGAVMDLILAALAKAVQSMPMIEFIEFIGGSDKLVADTEIDDPDLGTFIITYHSPGVWKHGNYLHETKEDQTFRRVYYSCEHGKEWRPDWDTALALKKAGEEKFGGKVIEGSRKLIVWW